MIRPTERAPHHSPSKQLLALVLAWLTIAGSMPPRALSSPLPVARPVRLAASFKTSLPEPEPVPAALAPLPLPAPNDTDAEARKWGEITVGQPKIWQYERVNSLLDGLLRDVQGVSMSDLVSLDANATNGAAVKFVQSMLEIGVKYDQGAAIGNALALKNYTAAQNLASTQIQANSAYLQQLYAQRTSLTAQLVAATEQNATLLGQIAATDPSSTAAKTLATQQQSAASAVTGLQTELTSINSQITAASTPTPLPTLTTTSAPQAPESPTTFSSFLSGLPSALQTNIMNQLQSPSLPATKRMDNFVTLLYERLAREISVLQDDVMRDPENVAYLVQFDVGLYPGVRARNHVGFVEFTMDCEGCKVYSIYPGQSSYNLANYDAASKRYSIWGALATILGFGVSADYRRQTDTLHGDLVQSVYMSGFQEGAASSDRVGNDQVEQRFGWQYGSAPFEELVTPGIRSTFAIISVPRKLIATCDKEPEKCPAGLTGDFDEQTGNTNIGLKIDAHADWVRRDDPFKQQKGTPPNSLVGSSRTVGSWFAGSRMNLQDAGAYEQKFLSVTLPGTEGLLNVHEVVLAERDRLHVLGMEYNPVYDAPPPQPTTGAAAASTPPSPGTASATASGNGSGTTTVSVSGSGTASASSSGTASTTVTASAANPTATPTPSGSPPPTDPLTGCKLGQCATILIRLAEPLDPNLVVTVRGLPLQRVRDWRGRATSVLPPAQSASDFRLPSAAVAAGMSAALVGTENAPSASLLESDLPGPDTWMEVDSHRLMLTVSKNLVGEDEEFPTIQILDPAKRALFLPQELDTGFSEVIMNGFHFPTRNDKQLRTYLNDHLLRQRSDETPTSGLHPAGPYPHETFLPLFLPRPEPRPIYAYLGETGTQILIGMDRFRSESVKNSPPPTPKSWLAGRVQVVLSDKYLDLAWSLSCDPQTSILVCDVPREEIRDAYAIVEKLCVDANGSELCPAVSTTMEAFPSISTLQVHVEQYDPDGGNSFDSAAPARLGRFPVQADDSKASLDADTGPDIGFDPWHFDSATQDWVQLTGCNYPDLPHEIEILGVRIPDKYRAQELRAVSNAGRSCEWFLIPTLALSSPEVIVAYRAATRGAKTLPTKKERPSVGPVSAGSDPCSPNAATKLTCTPESLAAALFQPFFEAPTAIPHLTSAAGKKKIADSWKIDIPAGRLDCDDTLNIPNASETLHPTWKIGATLVPLRDMGSALPMPGKDTDSVPPACKNQLESAASIAHAKANQSGQELATKSAAAKSKRKAATDDASAAKGKTGADAVQAAKKAAQSNKDAQTAEAAEKAAQSQHQTDLDLAKAADAATKNGAGDWEEASKTGQLVLELTVNRTDLGSLSLTDRIQVLRGRLLSKIASLPDLRPSFLPTKLTVVTEGPSQFALQGENAGVIDAVTVQGPDGTITTINAVSAGNLATITLPAPAKTQDKAATPAKPAIKDFPTNSVAVGKQIEIVGSGFGADAGTVKFGKVTAPVGLNCWSDGSIKLDVPPGVPAGSVNVTVTPKAKGASVAQAPFLVVGTPLPRPDSISCPATSAPASDSQTGSGSKAGAYSIIPLIALTGGDQGAAAQYLPLDVTDPAGKPLSFTATEQKSSASTAPKGVDSPTTTLTISKKTTVTPPATGTSAGQ